MGTPKRSSRKTSCSRTSCCTGGRRRPLHLRAFITRPGTSRLPLLLVLTAFPSLSRAQAVGAAERAGPGAGDPGMSTMLVLAQPQFRVLRDYAEPGATRRMHSHDDATWHVLMLVTGQLRLTVDGEAPVDVTQGHGLNLKGGDKHTFTNTTTPTP